MVKLSRVESTSSVKNSCCDILKLYWWLEIKTAIPPCVFYFGPFSREKEAKVSQYSHIDYLLQEKFQGITLEVKQLEPKELIIPGY
ncbi:MAG: DUF1816 domain-containing protein [Xenococcaceae cyanobacterium MO_207.B15]|nr:DUF1816 domain-containing protein [Xenococcaceae cyanobacterium MO_207.B15]MDJ0747495.1 DUF1816 domain-containing protein [Xenococcaceae cyanobacterium MO_167.B27]